MTETLRFPMNRYLFCPVCGERLLVELANTQLPEVHRLPEHRPLGNSYPGDFVANLCAGLVVTVTFDLDHCSECGARMSKHETGLCRNCFGKSKKE